MGPDRNISVAARSSQRRVSVAHEYELIEWLEISRAPRHVEKHNN